MKINLIDIDGNYPNLALMKLSSHWKGQGADVALNSLRKADRTYISVVFTKNLRKAKFVQQTTNGIIGGSGTGDYTTILPDEVEHTCPDYSLYGIDYSLGFTSRGCVRDCGFCIVREKEGGQKEHSKLSEFVRHKKVTLLDNNYMASKYFFEKTQEMVDRKLIVDFNQGLDIRLMTKEKADMLAKLNPPYLRFAWDSMDLFDQVKNGIRRLAIAGYPINRNRIGFYVLTGYDTTQKQDIYRLDFLHKMDINTHVQPFVKNRTNNRLSRWGNSPMIWTKCRFSEYTG